VSTPVIVSGDSNRQKRRPFWLRMAQRPVQFVLDVSILSATFVIAYSLRFDFSVPQSNVENLLIQLPLVVLLQFSAMQLFGVYSFVWRYIGMAEIQAFLKAAWWSFIAVLILRLGLPDAYGQWRVPLSIIIIDTLIAFGGALGVRVLRRALYERYERVHQAGRSANGHTKRVLLVGAGRAGVLAAREIHGRADLGLSILGFVDDDLTKHGNVIQGIRVLGSADDIPNLVEQLKIDHVIITIATASRGDIRRIVKVCEAIPVRVRIIPGLYELLGGTVEVSRIRDVEIEDLLGREPIILDEHAISSFLHDRVVMVTGAGGSIGSELCRQACRYGVRTIVLAERAEFALFEIDRELREKSPDIEVVPRVVDISDTRRLKRCFETYHPDVVLHAAAHKHVPLMEFNPVEAVRNNILATQTLGELCGEYGVERFIFISTDKAVKPSSIMGATKRVAELVIQDLNRKFSTRFLAVRFGNVLGSAGSVIPIFKRQILAGGPVTVTHRDMVRYFMTIPEASQLVLQAGAIGEGGEIFILNMGEPVRIIDLAKEMIALMGFKPYEDIDIVFSGIRPGEKLFEELMTDDETTQRTAHPKILVGEIAGVSGVELEEASVLFAKLVDDGEEDAIRSYISRIVPESRLGSANGVEDVVSENECLLRGSKAAL